MAETPRLDLPYLAASQAQKEIYHNISLDRLDLLVQCAVLDRNLATPPGSPTAGAAYIVGAAPTGAWATHADHLALYVNSQWQFIAPLPGFQCWVIDETALVYWDGAAWTPSSASGVTTFLGLSDSPDSYSGQGGKAVVVNAGATGLEFGTASGGGTFLSLSDTPDAYAGAATQYVRVNSGATALEFAAGTIGTFLNLSDTPDTYAGQNGKVVSVKSDATGVEFIPQASGTLGLHRGALLALSADQAIADNAPTVVSWSSATYDTSSVWSAGQPTRVVVPAGVTRFMCMAQVELDGATVGVRRVRILHNGTTVAGQGTTQQPVEASTLPQPHVVLGVQTPPLAVVAGDYFEVEVLQASGAALNAVGDVQTWFAGLLISEMGSGGASTFLELGDTPDAYTGQAGKAVLVNAGATALEFGTPAAGATTFLALTDSPDSYAGQAGKGVTVNGAATGLEFTTAVTGSYDLGVTWAGTLPASQVLLRYPFPRAVDFPAGLTASQGRAAVAATALTTLDLRKNGTSVGSVQFAAAGTTATFTMASATSFAAGDVLTVHAPGTADGTLADLGLSLAGTRAVAAGEMGATTFLGLTDTPDVYASNALKILRVNAGATATEFGPVLGTLAQQDAHAVAITGGSVVNLAALSVTTAPGTTFFGYDVTITPGTLKLGNGTPPLPTRQFLPYPRATAQGLLIQPDADTGGGNALLFTNAAGAYVGSISTTATATAYNTSSDARLKHAIAPLTGALDVLAALRPVAFRWNVNEEPGIGFLAHELQQVVPEAVTGTPDAVGPQGDIVPQGVDHSRLVPWLVAALQATLMQVQALTARVASLEEPLGV